MSQVSPDGQYVVTTVNPAAMAAACRGPQQLLRRQFQGLPVPAGVLSDARGSELVQPRDRSPAAAARRRRPAVRADGRRLEPGRRVPGICARAGHATRIRRVCRWRNSPTIPTSCNFSMTSTGFRSATAREACRSRSRRVAERHEQHLPQSIARMGDGSSS